MRLPGVSGGEMGRELELHFVWLDTARQNCCLEMCRVYGEIVMKKKPLAKKSKSKQSLAQKLRAITVSVARLERVADPKTAARDLRKAERDGYANGYDEGIRLFDKSSEDEECKKQLMEALIRGNDIGLVGKKLKGLLAAVGGWSKIDNWQYSNGAVVMCDPRNRPKPTRR